MGLFRACLPALILGAVALMPNPASAQSVTIEASGQRLTIHDDTGRVPHNGAGVAARVRVGRRVGMGLGVSRLGRSSDRLVLVEGQLSVDLLASPTVRAAMPYVVLSIGVMNQKQLTGIVQSSSDSFIAELTAGVRLRVTDHLFIAPTASLGVTAYPYRRFGIAGGVIF